MNTTPRSVVSVLALATLMCGAALAQTAPGGATPPGPRQAGPGLHGAGPGGPGGPGWQGRQGHREGERAHGGAMGMGPMMLLLGRGQDRALDLVKATPQQRADIRRIAGAARDDLRAARHDGRPRSEALLAAWTADRVDASALEAERARMAVRRDAAGKRMVQAMVDMGAVLNADQRRLLAEQWSRRGGHRRAEWMELDDEHAQAVADRG
ncbi:MAG: Spy/CpxP family protein refolding chaperone [Betaproteobacteria bacterium]|jgi:protein CpxP